MLAFLLDLGIAGTYFLSAAFSLAVVLGIVALLRMPPAPVRWRCIDCGTDFDTWPTLDAHEATHRTHRSHA